MPTPVAAANAYANLARLTSPGAGLSRVLGDPPAGPSFDALVKEALANVVDAGRKSDAQAQAAASGKANMVDLVTAVAESETAIATLVSVRDRVIQAYQTILQMPI
ncbi:MAG TPA: flagellar hook-basal body complex protein FliE [Xanthobacteraceae bacterium]|jgi:flagellar hook-basal body complex protein FliE|nr:flagellar hook-basal body complex protein FliE [Xanthobacteraceae bacterium]